MDVQKREDRLLDELATLYGQRRMAVATLALFEYAYPELETFVSELRKCLGVADD
jgi:hypothetical protein